MLLYGPEVANLLWLRDKPPRQRQRSLAMRGIGNRGEAMVSCPVRVTADCSDGLRHNFGCSRHSVLTMQDADGFMELYRREREVVLLFIARRTFDPALAADLTAETFATALASWSRLQGRSDEEARAWLFTVARRQISRYFRHLDVERRATQRLGISVPVLHEDDAAEIEERAGLAELRAAVGLELERLSGEQREALLLRVVEEHPYDEVALMLGITEQAARARVSRGLRALAGSLEPHRAEWEATR